MSAHLIRAFWMALAVAVFVGLVSIRATGMRVEWTVATTAPGPAELFHAEGGNFTAERSRAFPIIADARSHSYVVDLPTASPTETLRLDPATGPGSIVSERLRVRWRVLGVPSRSRPLAITPEGAHEIEVSAPEGSVTRMAARGGDPWVHLTLPDDASSGLWMHRAAVSIASGLAAAAIWLAVLALVAASRRAWSRFYPASGRVAAALRALGSHASDPGAVRFGASATGFLLACMLGAVVGVTANLNQSSVAVWNDFLPSAAATDSTLLGSARSIRSDEWLVFTPWMLSQAASGLPSDNRNLGGQSTPLLTSMPVAHPVMWVQPEFWGFAMFGPERAISWHWMFKVFGLLTSAFVLLMLLTRNDSLISALGATWLWLSSFTQWWFSAGIPEILIGFCLTMSGVLYIAGAQRLRGLVAGATLLVVGACTFALQMYPPFQIPLAWAGVAIVVGTLFDAHAREAFAVHARRRVVAYAVAGAVIALVLAIFIVDVRPTVAAVLDTAYPGRRSSVGGSLGWWDLFNGAFELWRIGERRFPGGTNASEASDFVLLFPVALMILVAIRKRARQFPVLIALTVFCVLLAAWAAVPLPEGAAQPVAAATMLSYVPPGRSIAGLGAASILLCCMVVAAQARFRTATPTTPGTAAIAVGLSVLVTLQVGGWILRVDPGFMTGWRILMGCAVVGLGTAAMVMGRRRWLAVMIVLVGLPGLAVNPVNQGLGPLVDRPVLQAARLADDDGRWIALGNFTLAQALKASGLQVFGGATYVPDRGDMNSLDPSEAQADVWNRYAHIQVESAPGIDRPEFTLVQADHYVVRIDVCRDGPALGIDRAAYAGIAPEADMACLEPVGGGPVDGISLYRLRAPVATAGSID